MKTKNPTCKLYLYSFPYVRTATSTELRKYETFLYSRQFVLAISLTRNMFNMNNIAVYTTASLQNYSSL